LSHAQIAVLKKKNRKKKEKKERKWKGRSEKDNFSSDYNHYYNVIVIIKREGLLWCPKSSCN